MEDERNPKKLSEFARTFLTEIGACEVGVCTTETLAGGPPSTDLEYVLPGAKSAVSFAVPMDQEKIERYLAKESHADHQEDNIQVNFKVSGMAAGLADYWNQKGIPSKGVAVNAVYRHDTPGGMYDFKPDISHRYLAVRSGVGWFGLSGNVITPNHGASVILGSVVTTAELEPSQPRDEDGKYCDECQLCFASCTSGLMAKKARTSVSLGDREFSHSERRTFQRCDLVCGGFAGLAKNGKWSTWSPGRFEVPEKDEDVEDTLIGAVGASLLRPEIPGGFHHSAFPASKKLNVTCANCQLICHPDRDERKRRYKLLIKGGVVVQNPDGTLEAVAPAEAKRRMAAMSPEQRAMYEKV
ncbi:MAG: epoxyqueuosine reductase [bacterium]|nr:epoxyqueuosine reductase [bacterium]